jgi:hypothetical protein
MSKQKCGDRIISQIRMAYKRQCCRNQVSSAIQFWILKKVSEAKATSPEMWTYIRPEQAHTCAQAKICIEEDIRRIGSLQG